MCFSDFVTHLTRKLLQLYIVLDFRFKSFKEAVCDCYSLNLPVNLVRDDDQSRESFLVDNRQGTSRPPTDHLFGKLGASSCIRGDHANNIAEQVEQPGVDLLGGKLSEVRVLVTVNQIGRAVLEP